MTKRMTMAECEAADEKDAFWQKVSKLISMPVGQLNMLQLDAMFDLVRDAKYRGTPLGLEYAKETVARLEILGVTV